MSFNQNAEGWDDRKWNVTTASVNRMRTHTVMRSNWQWKARIQQRWWTLYKVWNVSPVCPSSLHEGTLHSRLISFTEHIHSHFLKSKCSVLWLLLFHFELMSVLFYLPVSQMSLRCHQIESWHAGILSSIPTFVSPTPRDERRAKYGSEFKLFVKSPENMEYFDPKSMIKYFCLYMQTCTHWVGIFTEAERCQKTNVYNASHQISNACPNTSNNTNKITRKG